MYNRFAEAERLNKNYSYDIMLSASPVLQKPLHIKNDLSILTENLSFREYSVHFFSQDNYKILQQSGIYCQRTSDLVIY